MVVSRCQCGLAVLLFLVLSACTTMEPLQPVPKGAPIPSRQIEGLGPGNRTPYVVLGKTYDIMPSSLGYLEIGVASWYGRKFHGRLTSNGEIFDMYEVSAAHKALPLPTIVQVTNLDNGRKIIARVNDRGPFHDDRLIDLSFEAARQLGFEGRGLAPVVVEALDELNYPDLVAKDVPHESFYLQMGAFSRLEGAETLQGNIRDVIELTEFAGIDVRILQSDIGDEMTLHKVWLGPIATESERDKLAVLVESANLGLPLRVKVD